MSAELGFIVLELNQASGQPAAYTGDVHLERHRDDAEAEAERGRAEAKASGRRERYVIASLIVAEDDLHA